MSNEIFGGYAVLAEYADLAGARRAIDALQCSVDHVLVDGNWDFVGGGNVTRLVKGDATSLSIAAASKLVESNLDSDANRRLVLDYLATIGQRH